jgi:signal transduction histidine kinase/ActR/RegA family two-component response regulator
VPIIDSLTDRAIPLGPQCTAAQAHARFQREPDTLVLAIVEEDGRPLGLIERTAFYDRMSDGFSRSMYGHRPVTLLMEPEPVIVEASTEISSFSDSMLTERAATLLRGFIVTDKGRYVGTGVMLRLLQATSALARERADELAARVRHLGDVHTQAQTSAKAKSQFLSVMSHELRTPMNGVLAVAELLQRQPLGPDAQAYVQTIIDSSETLLRTLSDAVDLARAEAGELEIAPQPAFVRELMDDLQAVWAPRAAQDGVNLLVSYDGDPDLAAEIDSGRLKQVFNNLIAAALRFARNGVVEASLKATAESDRIRLEARVRDTGQGATQLQLDGAFEPFSADGIQAAPGGLGLSICRQIVDRLGGRIWADTNAGKGATFAFELSAKRCWIDRPGESNVSELAELHLQAQPHILIVDDNATNRVVAQALCEMFGCTSECAEDGAEALEAVRSRRFDLVLMDIKMPRMDGVQATRAIRALNGPEKDVPIIALTANADPDDAKNYLNIGMAAVVEKPIKPERLRAAMNMALDSEAESSAGGLYDAGDRSAVA